MATDYVFVGMVLTFVTGMTMMILAFEKRKFPVAPIYHFWAAICFFVLGQFSLMATATSTVGLPIWMLFFGFGLMNFVVFFIWVWQVFNIYKLKKMEDQEMKENE